MILKRLSLPAAVSAACLAVTVAAPPAHAVEALETVRVASGMIRPIYATYAPDDYKRLYIIEKRGLIRILDLTTNTLNATAFMNIDSIVTGGTSNNSEQGLLGLAFHPDFRTNGLFYVNYTGSGGQTIIAEYGTTSPDLADLSTARTVIQFSQPFSNHNGGWIGFSPTDPGNYLYIATGDGGSAGDPGNRAQDITSQRLGKLLRLDVDGRDIGGRYSIPPGNPFIDITGDDEIWAYGLRNPWQTDFDRDTGDMYIADVGQNAREEIDFQPANSTGGENYGWRCREGFINFGGCSGDFVEPIHDYVHGGSQGGFSVSGGGVYRGCAIPTLRGHYLFGDFVLQRIWSFKYDGSTLTEFTTRTTELSPSQGGVTVNQITAMAEDARGEMYIIDQGSGSDGQIFRIVPAVPTIEPADINCNGAVEFGDLNEVLAKWGQECIACPQDVSGDGNVEFSDILEVIGNWD